MCILCALHTFAIFCVFLQHLNCRIVYFILILCISVPPDSNTEDSILNLFILNCSYCIFKVDFVSPVLNNFLVLIVVVLILCIQCCTCMTFVSLLNVGLQMEYGDFAISDASIFSIYVNDQCHCRPWPVDKVNFRIIQNSWSN